MEEGKVISIFSRKRNLQSSKEESSAAEETVEIKEELSFEETMKKNELVKERMKQDRSKANQSVLRSYKLKS